MPPQTYRLVTVNTVPARAKILIGRLVEEVKEQYTIEYVANSERIEDVKATCEEFKPDVLFCASMWTKEESDQIQAIAKETIPEIKTMAIPHGLQVDKGPDAIVEFLREKWPEVVGS
jgi:hypothetical protein